MQTVTLYIETPTGQQVVRLDQEISIGRTNLAQLVVNDPSLSRLHATIFREGGDIWILDEKSSNGTFVNGERVSPEKKLKDGDEILLGSDTRIYVEIAQPFGNTQPKPAATTSTAKPSVTATNATQIPTTPAPSQKPSLPLIPIIAGTFAFFIVVFAGIALFLVSRGSGGGASGNSTPGPTMRVNFDSVIPVRVIDPLGGEDPDDIDHFLSSWEGEEEPLKAEDIEVIKVSADSTLPDGTKAGMNLNVSPEFWKQQMGKALSRPKIGGELLYTPQMYDGRTGFAKQLLKGAQLRDGGYKVPMDFADLAELRLKGVLVEMPIATETYVLDVGGSAGEGVFTEFTWQGDIPIQPGSEKYQILEKLAKNFGGREYNLNVPQDRKQMRMRLLRMFNANSRKLFLDICAAYYERFKVPLRVTSLMRSMDYQRQLNRVNGNSYNVRPGTVPPHTTGNTFDVGRNHLPADAQNFLIKTLSDFEAQGRLDTLIEGNVNACFHTFIYPDGVGPSQTTVATKPKPAASPATQKPKSEK
jgi:pSer/pThr/pTyr-binding forkhead associated (FHA) protein